MSMFRITYDFPKPRGSRSHVDRAYRAPVYKADPDDFGLLVGAVLGGELAGVIAAYAVKQANP